MTTLAWLQVCYLLCFAFSHIHYIAARCPGSMGISPSLSAASCLLGHGHLISILTSIGHRVNGVEIAFAVFVCAVGHSICRHAVRRHPLTWILIFKVVTTDATVCSFCVLIVGLASSGLLGFFLVISFYHWMLVFQSCDQFGIRWLKY